MTTLTVYGDLHGHFKHLDLVQSGDYSLCVGDVGFHYKELKRSYKKRGVNTDRHKMLAGNHENYQVLLNPSTRPPFFLDDFGVWEIEGVKLFYVRGAHSIDKIIRQEKDKNFFNAKDPNPQQGVQYRSWYPEEELNTDQQEKCVQLYREVRPDIVVSHDCPQFFAHKHYETLATFKEYPFEHSQTRLLLDRLHGIHFPCLWLFGHWHKPGGFVSQEGPTKFIHLDMDRRTENKVGWFTTIALGD